MLNGIYKYVGAKKIASKEKGNCCFINVIDDSGDVLKLFAREPMVLNKIDSIIAFSDVTLEFNLSEFKGYPSINLVDINKALGGKDK
jgi:hypothetical protein